MNRRARTGCCAGQVRPGRPRSGSPRSRRPRAALVAVTLATIVVAASACGTTVDETAPGGQTLPPGARPADGGSALIDGGSIVDTGPPTTLPVEGSAADLLPELAVEMSRLGSLIAEGDGDDEALARIEAIWTQIRPEIETTHPELVNGIGAMIDMARTAVERTRPADADKAFSVLTDLVDRYTGDG